MGLEAAATATSLDIATHEIARLAWLRSYQILDTARDLVFDRLVAAAAQAFRAPAAGIGFLDADRLWFKAQLGFELEGEAERIGSCLPAILSAQALVVEDLARDARGGLGPVWMGRSYYRFYAGVPLFAPAGLRLGTLCVLDYQPRAASAREVDLLCDLAQDVMQALERRRHRVRHRPGPSRRRLP